MKPHLCCKLSLHNIYILLGICRLLYLIDCTTESYCQQKNDQQCNINLNLQKQTREVVMMKSLPRIDPIKVSLFLCIRCYSICYSFSFIDIYSYSDFITVNLEFWASVSVFNTFGTVQLGWN